MNEQYGYRLEVFKVLNGKRETFFDAKPGNTTDKLSTLLLNVISALTSLRNKIILNESKSKIKSNGKLLYKKNKAYSTKNS